MVKKTKQAHSDWQQQYAVDFKNVAALFLKQELSSTDEKVGNSDFNLSAKVFIE